MSSVSRKRGVVTVTEAQVERVGFTGTGVELALRMADGFALVNFLAVGSSAGKRYRVTFEPIEEAEDG